MGVLIDEFHVEVRIRPTAGYTQADGNRTCNGDILVQNLKTIVFSYSSSKTIDDDESCVPMLFCNLCQNNA